jgi:hypothetical protein
MIEDVERFLAARTGLPVAARAHELLAGTFVGLFVRTRSALTSSSRPRSEPFGPRAAGLPARVFLATT